jgi:hypothetical protein
MIDRQIWLRHGDRLRPWVRRRIAEVRRAKRADAFRPYNRAFQDARFVAGLHGDRIADPVTDLRPPVDDGVRECLVASR